MADDLKKLIVEINSKNKSSAFMSLEDLVAFLKAEITRRNPEKDAEENVLKHQDIEVALEEPHTIFAADTEGSNAQSAPVPPVTPTLKANQLPASALVRRPHRRNPASRPMLQTSLQIMAKAATINSTILPLLRQVGLVPSHFSSTSSEHHDRKRGAREETPDAAIKRQKTSQAIALVFESVK